MKITAVCVQHWIFSFQYFSAVRHGLQEVTGLYGQSSDNTRSTAAQYVSHWVTAESNERFIEGQAFSQSYNLAPTPPPPPVPSVSDRRHKGRLRKRNNLLRGTGEGVGEESNHTTAKKPGPVKMIQYFLGIWASGQSLQSVVEPCTD